MSDTIEKREFVRQFSKYLKQKGTYVVCGRYGSVEVEIRDVRQDRDNMSDNAKNEPIVRQDVATIRQTKREHHCGCKREEGKPLCSKHGRL